MCVRVCVCVHVCTHACWVVSDSLHPLHHILLSSSVRGILHARILEWVAISFSRGSSWPRDQTHVYCVSCIIRWILYPLAPSGKPHHQVELSNSQRDWFSLQQGDILFIFSQHLTTAQIRLRKSSSTSKPKALSLTSHTLEWLRGRAVLSSKSSVYGAVRLVADSDATDVSHSLGYLLTFGRSELDWILS